MSTRSTVSVYDGHGIYYTIYGHWDGSLSGVGKMLYHNYNDIAAAEDLIDLGSFSRLGDTLESSVFYTRDFYEAYELNKAAQYKDLAQLPHQEYNYLFTGNHWFYNISDCEKRTWRTLTNKVIDGDDDGRKVLGL